MGSFFQSAFDLIMFIFDWLIDVEFILYVVGVCIVITAFDLLKKLLFEMW